MNGSTADFPTSTRGSATVPVGPGNRTEITIDSDIYMLQGSTVQLMVRGVSLSVNNIQVVSHTIRVSGNGHG